jgi:hypothetical protein
VAAAVLDAVGRARDNHAARLFWYTDFERAKAAATAAGKPMLSLRLLGNLDDEYSCANSRFFRTVLYADPAVGSMLRERFVLHWQSVRPVPRVTIDFGDGRTLMRTLTGNSIHYVLDAKGRPVDALPGLYGPQAFLRGLGAALAIHAALSDLAEPARTAALRREHQTRYDAVAAAWRIGVGDPLARPGDVRPASVTTPTAEQAAELTFAKVQVERPMLNTGPRTPREVETAEGASDASGWERVAARHMGDARLDTASIRLMAAKSRPDRCGPVDPRRSALAESGRVRAFTRRLALDTVKNEYEFHARLHEWFAAGAAPANVDELNERVYAELFLTPSSDPWLGLMPDDGYVALPGDGVLSASR